jgi:hypothetical protein
MATNNFAHRNLLALKNTDRITHQNAAGVNIKK